MFTVFIDASYAGDLLGRAKQLYDFAKNHRGIYSQSISNAKDFYGLVYFIRLLWVSVLYKYQYEEYA